MNEESTAAREVGDGADGTEDVNGDGTNGAPGIDANGVDVVDDGERADGRDGRDRAGSGDGRGHAAGRDDGVRADGGGESDGEDTPNAGDTFGVGIRVTAEKLQFAVHVPTDIDSGWTDREAFQRRIEAVTWDLLDREATLRQVAASASEGETVTLGTVTLRPDGSVVSHSLSPPGTGAGGED